MPAGPDPSRRGRGGAFRARPQAAAGKGTRSHHDGLRAMRGGAILPPEGRATPRAKSPIAWTSRQDMGIGRRTSSTGGLASKRASAAGAMCGSGSGTWNRPHRPARRRGPRRRQQPPAPARPMQPHQVRPRHACLRMRLETAPHRNTDQAILRRWQRPCTINVVLAAWSQGRPVHARQRLFTRRAFRHEREVGGNAGTAVAAAVAAAAATPF